MNLIGHVPIAIVLSLSYAYSAINLIIVSWYIFLLPLRIQLVLRPWCNKTFMLIKKHRSCFVLIVDIMFWDMMGFSRRTSYFYYFYSFFLGVGGADFAVISADSKWEIKFLYLCTLHSYAQINFAFGMPLTLQQNWLTSGSCGQV